MVLRTRDLAPWLDLGLDDKKVITVDEQPEIKRRVVEFLKDKNPVTIDGERREGTLDRIHFIYRTLRTSGVIDPPRDLDVNSATLGVIFYYPTDELPEEVSMEWELCDEGAFQVSAVLFLRPPIQVEASRSACRPAAEAQPVGGLDSGTHRTQPRD